MDMSNHFCQLIKIPNAVYLGLFRTEKGLERRLGHTLFRRLFHAQSNHFANSICQKNEKRKENVSFESKWKFKNGKSSQRRIPASSPLRISCPSWSANACYQVSHLCLTFANSICRLFIHKHFSIRLDEGAFFFSIFLGLNLGIA